MRTGKFLTIVGGILGGVGAIATVVGIVLAIMSVSFQAGSTSTSGTVVRVHKERDCDDYDQDRSGEDCSTVYRPTVRFRTESGHRITFTSKVATDHKRPTGSAVSVRYWKDHPRKARIDSFASNWLAPLIVGGLGLLFAAIGSPLFVSGMRKRRMVAWLQQSGTRVQALLGPPQLDRTQTIGGYHPWRVFASWKDPATGKLHQFRSDAITVDPTLNLEGHRTIGVLIDPQQPGKRYTVDLSTVGLGFD